MGNNKDRSMMEKCISSETSQLFKEFGNCEHPLDSVIIEEMKKLHDTICTNDDYEIFRHLDEVDALWGLLLEKAIKCLRYYDSREPYIEKKEKKPIAYGMDELKKYYQKYKTFERLLYASGQYYRDHVIHVFRVWLSGIVCMVKNKGEYLQFISICDEKTIELNAVEKLSIWTIIALTHDLGYPLEKAKDIIDATHDMVSTFVTNPAISLDLSFHGAQNYMNDFIVRLMSSKMIKTDKSEPLYVARLQPKYYFKFQKSLEKTEHGIMSTLIIYKLLTYFLESDYNINEDYTFDTKDSRQFYIRREILRAIASHTCKDIYHLYIGSFAFLLIVADNTQEWGRKNISELYVPSGDTHELKDIFMKISSAKDNPHICEIEEKIVISKEKGVKTVLDLLNRLRNQALKYVTILRDGQETKYRDFTFISKFIIQYTSSPEIIINMNLEISNNAASCLNGEIIYTGDQSSDKEFGEDFIKTLREKTGASINMELRDSQGNAKNANPDKGDKGIFKISLANENDCII